MKAVGFAMMAYQRLGHDLLLPTYNILLATCYVLLTTYYLVRNHVDDVDDDDEHNTL